MTLSPTCSPPLYRHGCKTKLLPVLLPCFRRPIGLFVELFMGTGAVTLAMTGQCRYQIANDADADISNLYHVLQTQPDALLSAVYHLPQHDELFTYWQTHREVTPLNRALRFLFLSNWGYLGNADTMRFGKHNAKLLLLEKLEAVFGKLAFVQFMACDFRAVFSKIDARSLYAPDTFVYCDPPYLDTDANYAGFTRRDTEELLALLVTSKLAFALSEFAHPYVLALADFYKLQIIHLGECQTLKNRADEILIVNYPVTFADAPA